MARSGRCRKSRRSVQQLIVAVEERAGIADEACVAAVDGAGFSSLRIQRQAVIAADENGPHGSTGGAGVRSARAQAASRREAP